MTLFVLYKLYKPSNFPTVSLPLSSVLRAWYALSTGTLQIYSQIRPFFCATYNITFPQKKLHFAECNYSRTVPHLYFSNNAMASVRNLPIRSLWSLVSGYLDVGHIFLLIFLGNFHPLGSVQHKIKESPGANTLISYYGLDFFPFLTSLQAVLWIQRDFFSGQDLTFQMVSDPDLDPPSDPTRFFSGTSNINFTFVSSFCKCDRLHITTKYKLFRGILFERKKNIF